MCLRQMHYKPLHDTVSHSRQKHSVHSGSNIDPLTPESPGIMVGTGNKKLQGRKKAPLWSFFGEN
jgi:hypothetical protein